MEAVEAEPLLGKQEQWGHLALEQWVLETQGAYLVERGSDLEEVLLQEVVATGLEVGLQAPAGRIWTVRGAPLTQPLPRVPTLVSLRSGVTVQAQVEWAAVQQAWSQPDKGFGGVWQQDTPAAAFGHLQLWRTGTK